MAKSISLRCLAVVGRAVLTMGKWKANEDTSGKWVAAAGKWFEDEVQDTGIQIGDDSKFFDISCIV